MWRSLIMLSGDKAHQYPQIHKEVGVLLAELFSFFSLRFSLMVSLAFFLISRPPLSLFPLSPISTPFELEKAKSVVLFLSMIHNAEYLPKSITALS